MDRPFAWKLVEPESDIRRSMDRASRCVVLAGPGIKTIVKLFCRSNARNVLRGGSRGSTPKMLRKSATRIARNCAAVPMTPHMAAARLRLWLCSTWPYCSKCICGHATLLLRRRATAPPTRQKWLVPVGVLQAHLKRAAHPQQARAIDAPSPWVSVFKVMLEFRPPFRTGSRTDAIATPGFFQLNGPLCAL